MESKSIELSYMTIKDRKIFIEKHLTFIKILEGKIRIRRNHEPQVLEKGDIILLNPGACFVLESLEGHNLLTKMILDKGITKGYEKGSGPKYYMFNTAYHEKDAPELHSKVRLILESITRYEVFENKRELHKHLKKLFDILINHFNYITCGMHQKLFSKKMRDRYTFIYKHYFKLSNHDSLLTISQDLHLNYDHLRKDISRRYGATYHQMKDVKRVNKAVQLLFDTDMSITDIGFKVGFSDHKYMVDRFKKRFDMTPSELRKLSNNDTSSYMTYMKTL